MKVSLMRSMAFLMVLAMVFSIAGCGAASPAGSSAASEATANAPAESSKEEQSPSAPAEKINLTMTSWGTIDEMGELISCVNAYNEFQDEVFVEVQTTPAGNYDEKLMTALAGGIGQDVFYAGESLVARLIKNGTIAEMTDILNSGDGYCKASDFADGLWGAARTPEGKIYALPPDCNPTLLYYSPKKFAELGIKDPWDYVAENKWNFDAFDETLDKLVAAGMKGFIMNGENFWIYNWMLSNGGTVWNGDTYKYDEKSLEAFRYVADRVKDGRFTYASALPNGQGADVAYISGQVGYVTAGRWFTPGFVDANVDFDYIPYPSNTGNAYPPIWIGTAYVCVNSKSQNTEAAKKFITFYCSQEGQKVRLGGNGGRPSGGIPSIDGIEDLIRAQNVPAHLDVLFDVRKNGWANGGDLIKDGLYGSMRDELKALAEEVFVNGKSVDEIAPQMEAKAAEVIALG